MPIEKAKRIKDSLQVGIGFRPKTPFTSEGSYSMEPTLEDPTDAKDYIHVLFGDLLCAVVADSTGRVLKTVNVAY
jgi:hypothetical protein